MFVDITDEGATLVEPDDCGRFHAQFAAGLADDSVAEVLLREGVGYRVDADHVAVKVLWLREAAQDVGGDWADRFAKMLAFAGTKGWLADDGASVLAHIAGS